MKRKRQPTRGSQDWVFLGFMTGGALGLGIGYMLSFLGVTLKGFSEWPHLITTICALVGSLVGLLAGIVHRFFIPLGPQRHARGHDKASGD